MFIGLPPHRAVFAVGLVLVLAPGSTCVASSGDLPSCPADQPCKVALSGEQVLALARQFFAARRFADARSALTALEASGEWRHERLFLEGLIGIETGDYQQAIRCFRTILNDDPSQLRVRLELARALYLNGDNAAADFHFRQAAAARPPQQVMANISRFRHDIDQRRTWTATVEVGLAPDTNINAATSDNTVDLFGVPFLLDGDARQSSGVGWLVNATLAARLGGTSPVSAATRLAVRHADYAGGSFDDSLVAGEFGPSVALASGKRLTISALGSVRWYGQRPYQQSYGVGLRLDSASQRTTSWNVGLEFRQTHYPDRGYLNGSFWRGTVEVALPASSHSYWIGVAEVIRENADDPSYGSVSARIGGGYGHEFGNALTVMAFAEVGGSWYDTRQWIFPETRRDTRVRGALNLTRRDWQFRGFAPTLRYSYVRNWSNLPLFTYDRHRLEVTIGRSF